MTWGASPWGARPWADGPAVAAADVTAAAASGSASWESNAPTPAIGIVAADVSASAAWSANAPAPVIDVVAPSASASAAWASNADVPQIAGDITAPDVSSSAGWLAAAPAPVVDEDRRGASDQAYYFSTVAPRAVARFKWTANAKRPRIGPMQRAQVAAVDLLPSLPALQVSVTTPTVVAATAYAASASPPIYVDRAAMLEAMHGAQLDLLLAGLTAKARNEITPAGIAALVRKSPASTGAQPRNWLLRNTNG